MTSPAPDMSKLKSSCPCKSTLSDYLLGLANDATSAGIDIHLESCSACNSVLSQLELELLPTIDRLQDETANVSDHAGLIDENQILHAAIASSKFPDTAEKMVWRSSLLHHVPEQVGPYRLLEAIGLGGMGCVYRAEHQKLHKAVALKLLPLGIANVHAVERFEREIIAAGKLSHPAIVNATDAGMDAGYLYLAMELIHGKDLGRIARSLEPLVIADVCEIGRQLALGLAHAHQMGMVHRDIKPSNVMLNTAGQVKLLDFGLVMLGQWDSPLGELTTVGQFLGTLDYMAPEQAERSANVDYRSDLYSLGATIFRLLTGQLPVAIFPNQSPLEKLRVLSSHSPIKIATLRPDVPEHLAKIIDQLLMTDPKLRPASAAHVAQALGEFCREADLSQLAKRTMQLPKEEQDERLHTFESKDQRVVQRPLAGGSNSHKNRWWLWIASAFLPFILYLGWTVIINDSMGNLVIQSEVDDLKVHVKKVDGPRLESLSIKQGNSLTKLRAGSYEIELEGPSDGLVMEPEFIELKHGETVIAKIHREGQNKAMLQSKDDSRDWLPKGAVSDELLRATYRDKSILDHLRQVHLERDYQTWLASVGILRQAIPAEDKKKLSSFIQTSAEQKGFLTGLDCLKLTDWVAYEEIDQRVADWLHNDDDHIIKFLGECTYRLQGGEFTEPEIAWTQLKRTWQEIEDWLRADSSLQRRLRIDSARRTAGGGFSQVFEVRLGTPLNSFLYENYPRIALAITQYYQYQTTSFDLQTGKDLLPPDSKDAQTRIEARLKLAREAVLKKDTQELFWTLKSTDKRAADVETEYWELVAGYISQRLDYWAESRDSVMKESIQIQMSAYDRSGWSIRSSASLQFYSQGGMGGMGGGMGGAYTQGLPPGVGAKISESVELLAAYLSLPDEQRPKDSLKKVRIMLEQKDRELTDALRDVFTRDWSSLSWTEDMKLQSYQPDGSTQLIDAADQDRAIAIVMHRWVVGLLDTDYLDPTTVVDSFFRELASDQSSQSTGRWIHAAVREKWSEKDFKTKLALIEGVEFQVTIINSTMDTATIVGNLVRGNMPTVGPTAQLRIRLELESEGWRIQSVEWIHGDKDSQLFN